VLGVSDASSKNLKYCPTLELEPVVVVVVVVVVVFVVVIVVVVEVTCIRKHVL